jgi:hypothetical protein
MIRRGKLRTHDGSNRKPTSPGNRRRRMPRKRKVENPPLRMMMRKKKTPKMRRTMFLRTLKGSLTMRTMSSSMKTGFLVLLPLGRRTTRSTGMRMLVMLAIARMRKRLQVATVRAKRSQLRDQNRRKGSSRCSFPFVVVYHVVDDIPCLPKWQAVVTLR